MKRVQLISHCVATCVLLTALFFVPVVQKKVSEEVLKRDAQLLLFQLHEDILDGLRLKQKVYELIPEGCTDDASNHLESFVLEHPSVRWISVLDINQRYCSNTSTKLTFEHKSKTAIGRDGYLSIISNEMIGEGLALISHSPHYELLILLDPLLIQFMSEFACDDCLAYRLFMPTALLDEKQIAEFGNAFSTAVSAIREEEGVTLRLELLASDDFVDMYFFQSLSVALLIGVSLAGLSYYLISQYLNVRWSIERLIKDGISNNEFVPFYQPVVNSQTGDVVGAELLVRWFRKDGTLIPPGQFIEAAEQTQLILPITEQLVKQACDDIKRFNWQHSSHFVSINLVPQHIENTDFYEFIKSQISASKIKPNNLSLELTERRPVTDFATAKRVLAQFTQMGVDIKLDDAGTGFGGFSYIQELGINTLKIDKMFVDTILHGGDLKRPVLESIIAFAKSSHLHVIAEGVEVKEQVQFLASKGVYDIQGYYYAKPMSAAAFTEWMKDKH